MGRAYAPNFLDHPQEFYRGKCSVCTACHLHKQTHQCPHGGPFAGYTGHIPMPNETPKLTIEEALAIIAAKTAPKVTKESIEAKIEGVSYLQHDHLTICVITMKNGFMALGKSAPASASNFDKEVGQRLAYDDAFRSLWAFEGYLLREILSTRAPEPKPEEAATT